MVDLVYAFVATLTAPVWLVRLMRTGKIRTDWAGRLGRLQPLPRTSAPRVLFHAVSVGEVNAIRALVEHLQSRVPELEVVIATTTDTGFARAQALWSQTHRIVRYPLDFSSAVRRVLNALQPDACVLVELELWPNFTSECARRGIPVIVVNGRLTQRSYSRYRIIKPLVRPMFRRLTCAAVQNQAYAQRFIALGAPAAAVTITGTMKWDTAMIADDVPGADELAQQMGIDRNRPLIVAGSTAPEEHRLLLAAKPPGVQLLCAPRKPEWFNQAAADLPGCVRRSATTGASGGASGGAAGAASGSRSSRRSGRDLFLLDTIGELRKAYALADIVVIGRSFGTLHGSDMMEPVALGKPVIVGPAVSDFQDTVEALLAEDGIVQTTSKNLRLTIFQLLNDPHRRATLANNGRNVIRKHQGATVRNANLILDLLHHDQDRLRGSEWQSHKEVITGEG